MRYEPYPAYKDSGVEWLGKIPEGWVARRIGFHFQDRREKVSDKDYPPLSVTMKGIVPQMEHVAKTEDNDNRKLVRSGDVVINSRSDRKGSSGLSSLDGSVSLINTVLIPDSHVFGWFAHHVIRSKAFQEEFYRYGKGIVADLWSTNYGEMKDISLPLPPLPSQQAIAAFLDTETARIEGLIKDYEELVALSQEKRQALISHAVTRGLSELVSPNDPDFGEWAKPVKFKDSGVEWLGKIPEGWSVPALSYHYEVQLGKMLDTAQITGSQLYAYLRNQDVQWGKINLEELPRMDFSEADRQKFSLRSGDLLVCEGGDVGRAAVWGHEEIPCFYQKALHRIRPINRTETDPRYLLFTLMMANKNGIFVGGEEKATIYHLTADRLRKFRLPLPRHEEQSAIANFLDKETAKIDMLMTEAESAIELLKEHRSALITNAVTGKINVESFLVPMAVSE